MSELHNTTNSTSRIRKSLLATASAFVLAMASLSQTAKAAESDRPTVWIEGGWHFEGVSGENDAFAPPLDVSTRANGFTPLATLENALGRTYGGEGSISFQPKGSDWVFTGSARFGRVHTARQTHEEKIIFGPHMYGHVGAASTKVPVTPIFNAYAIGSSSNSETHVVADFQVGKDVGIGLLGHETDTIISFGARYAQMNAKSKALSHGNPAVTFHQLVFFGKYYVGNEYQKSGAFVDRADSLHALGPSLSMKNTTGLLGTVEDGQLAIDWGVNAAVLFGRQKAQASYHSSVKHAYGLGIGGPPGVTSIYPLVTRSRSRTVAIPNVGGFAALSYRFTNAKINAGYRADFFFGAMDGGLDVRDSVTIGFHGPYATLSVGLGG